jgi:hypothetical protein
VKVGAEEVKKGFEVAVQRVTKIEVSPPPPSRGHSDALERFGRRPWARFVISCAQDYKFGDGTKALVESTKEGLEHLGKTLGIVPDYENDVFNVPLGCRRFILRPDSGTPRVLAGSYRICAFFMPLQMKTTTGQ